MNDAIDHAEHLEALADHLDPTVTTSEPVEADPDALREIAARLRRMYAGGDPDAAAQQPEG